MPKRDMIQRIPAAIEAPASEANWQAELARAISDPARLLEVLGLPAHLLAGGRAGARLFSIRVPLPYLRRIRHGDPGDPLLRQVLPLDAETREHPGFVTDPLEEARFSQGTGLVRKYRSRALLLLTGACAINCRYCFRRHFPYEAHRLPPTQRQEAMEQLRGDPAINEVILSGGDPLLMNDRLLAGLVRELETIPHLVRLRIHSRLPLVIPSRVNSSLLEWLASTRLQTVLVWHVNHPREIDTEVADAARKLGNIGVSQLNQSVILKRVNDDADTLAGLSETLFAAGIMPYYLHAFDPVAGAAHFHVEDDRARDLARELHARLPGFLVPRLVREVPGEAGKRPLL